MFRGYVKQIFSLVNQIGPFVQAARKSAGLSQAVLAQRLGISQSRVSAMELSPGSINVEQLSALCSTLNLELILQTKPPAGRQKRYDSKAGLVEMGRTSHSSVLSV